MLCPECGSDSPNVLISESFQCDCGNVNVVSYHMCPSCMTLWRAFNGALISNSIVKFEDVESNMNFLKGNSNLFDHLDMDIENLKRAQAASKDYKTMSDFIHKCLRCNAIAFQVSENCFRCAKCDFEWEVVDGE